MNYIYKIIKDTDNLTTLIATFITVLATVYIYLSNRYKKLHKDQLEKVYFPIYQELDGYFYSPSDNTLFLIAIDNIGKIINKNRLIAGNTLYSLFETFCKNKNKKAFKKLCDYIILMYNSQLKINGLPTISIRYITKCNSGINHKLFYIIKYYLKYLNHILTKVFLLSATITFLIFFLKKL